MGMLSAIEQRCSIHMVRMLAGGHGTFSSFHLTHSSLWEAVSPAVRFAIP